MCDEKAKAEVFRYLGRQNQETPAELDEMVAECMRLIREAGAPRSCSAVFSVKKLAENDVSLNNSSIVLSGSDISRHLDGCGEVVLMAATLGAGADSLIRRFDKTDLTRSLILDACATQLIEQVCDTLEDEIRAEAFVRGMAITPRFSPGYGDLSLDIQPLLLDALNAGMAIGLTCTKSAILLPRKSVTAIIGIGKAIENKKGRSCQTKCQTCLMNKDCAFKARKENNG